MTEPNPKIYEAMLAVMAEIDPIAKARKNEQQGFSFRSIDDVYDALHPALVQHGVICVPILTEHVVEEFKTTRGSVMARALVRMAFRFYAEDGSYIQAVTAGEASDSLDKATAKAMSVAYKYALFQTFCIPTGEDPDAESPAGPARAGRARSVGGQKIAPPDTKRLWAAVQVKAVELGGIDARGMLTDILGQFNLERSADIPRADTRKVFDAVESYKPEPPGDADSGVGTEGAGDDPGETDSGG